MAHTFLDLALAAISIVALAGWVWTARRAKTDKRGYGNNTHQRIRAEKALEESEKRLRLFTDAMPALFAYIDSDLRYRFCNLQFEKHFRRNREQVIGMRVDELLGPRAYGQVLPMFERALGGETVFYEQWIDYREAGRAFMRGSLVPDRAPQGDVQGVFAMVQDMTTRKAVEDNLALAKEKAEKTVESKSRFLATASHDLRQPMQALAMFIEVLAGRSHDTTSREIIEHIQASSKALEGLLNSLLDISKLEADMVEPAVRRFCVGDVMSRLAAEIEPLADAKGLRLTYIPSDQTVRTDPGLLDRILRNLLVNAIAYTDNGRILFGCRRRGNELAIEVRDTGVGIPDDQEKLIFQEFFRGASATQRSQSGLGLGLVIVDRLVKLLGHKVEVSSAVGRGSTFRVLVPMARKAPARVADSMRSAAQGSPGGLIVGIDDDPAVRDALSLLLQSWGFEAVVVASEAEAVTRLSEENKMPDLVIADYRLSDDGDGSSAINAIRRHWGARIPGLLLTGDTDPDGLEKAGASGYQVVKKPIRPEKLRDVVVEKMDAASNGEKIQRRRKSERPSAEAES